MLSRLLRQFLFTLVHFFINLLVAAQNVYHQFWVKKCSLPKDKTMKSDIAMILEHVPRMEKQLKHLVVLADMDHHTVSDLARVVIWSLIAGVPYISFHDITGELKENEEKLFSEIERFKKGVPGCIKWANKPNLNGYTNGIQAHTITVNIFTPKDGRPVIAQCIQQIAERKVPLHSESKEFNAQELDKALTHVYPCIPDPDLILYTGSSCCTYGFLPWQIRLTEFLRLSLDHSVNIDNYVGALYKYNKCEQRFGK